MFKVIMQSCNHFKPIFFASSFLFFFISGCEYSRITKLIDNLGSDSSITFKKAESELIIMGSPAVPALVKALVHNDNQWIRMRAAYILGSINDNTAVPNLIIALKDPFCAVREQAVIALGEFHNPVAAQPLIQAFDAVSCSSGYIARPWPLMIKTQIIIALRKIDTPICLDFFISLLNNNNHSIRIEAIERLNKTKIPEHLYADRKFEDILALLQKHRKAKEMSLIGLIMRCRFRIVFQ